METAFTFDLWVNTTYKVTYACTEMVSIYAGYVGYLCAVVHFLHLHIPPYWASSVNISIPSICEITHEHVIVHGDPYEYFTYAYDRCARI